MNVKFLIKISGPKAQPKSIHSSSFALALRRTLEQITHLNLLIFMKCCARGNLLKAWSIQMFAA